MLSIILLTALSLTSTINALPKKHKADPNATHTDGNGNTIFAPDWATCANDAWLSGPYPLASSVVINDCDGAIESVCAAADLMYKSQAAGDGLIPLKPLKKIVGTCEAHILFSGTTLADPLDHASCVADMQKISVECCVIGSGKWAKDGKQAGVMNLDYNPNGIANDPCGKNPRLQASTAYNGKPGYAIGQTGYFQFGACGYDPASVIPAPGTNEPATPVTNTPNGMPLETAPPVGR